MNVGKLAQALALAQSEIESAPKSSLNPHFRSRYSDLSEIWKACRSALTKNGIAVVQAPNFDSEGAWLETLLIHTSGEFIVGRFPLKPTKPDMQGFGSAISYAKRYSLAAMVGVISEEDDDGNKACERGPGPAAPTNTQPKVAPVVQTPTPPPAQPVKAKSSGAPFDPSNPDHMKILTGLINAKNCNRTKETQIEGMWLKAIFAELAGKPVTQLDAVILATDPNRADEPKE